MIFTPHLLVYLSAHGVSVASQQRGHFRFVGECLADSAGFQAFASMLTQFKHAKLSLLVDSVDEQYLAEDLPHVLGSARAQMLARRLRQVSRDNAFAAAWHQGRHQHARRDDRYLFVSLTTFDWAQVWLNLLAEQNVHLALLTTVPVVSHALLRHLPQKNTSLLWVTQQSGGVRLSYFSENRLLFSRLCTPESCHHAKQLAEEITKTRYYLTSHQYLSHQGALTVAVLDTHPNHVRLSEILNQETERRLSCEVYATDGIAQRLKIKTEDLHRYPDSLHLAALGRYAVAVNLATSAMVLGYRQRQWQRGFYLAAVTSMIMAAVAGGYLDTQRNQINMVLQQTHRQLAQLQQQFRSISLKMTSTPVPPANLKAAVELARALYAAPQPMNDFAVLSEVLAQHPSMALTRLAWQSREKSDAQPATVLVVDGEIRPFQGDYRAAMAYMDTFVADLRHHPKIAQVDVIAMPINRDPTLSLHQSAQSLSTTAAFRLKLRLRSAS